MIVKFLRRLSVSGRMYSKGDIDSILDDEAKRMMLEGWVVAVDLSHKEMEIKEPKKRTVYKVPKKRK